MLSILVSRFEVVFPYLKEELQKGIKQIMKVAIIPWAFSTEINSDILEKEFFLKYQRRYNKYMHCLRALGIKDDNVYICNCYKDTKKTLTNAINESDIIIIPGGNPEMLYQKIVEDTKILDDLKQYKGIIIGESAGCELHLKKYFITKENNYYGYFSYYDGLDLIGNPFYIDVHTQDNEEYRKQLYEVANTTNKKVYAIYDDGALIYNRETKNVKTYGQVEIIDNTN